LNLIFEFTLTLSWLRDEYGYIWTLFELINWLKHL